MDLTHIHFAWPCARRTTGAVVWVPRVPMPVPTPRRAAGSVHDSTRTVTVHDAVTVYGTVTVHDTVTVHGIVTVHGSHSTHTVTVHI